MKRTRNRKSATEETMQKKTRRKLKRTLTNIAHVHDWNKVLCRKSRYLVNFISVHVAIETHQPKRATWRSYLCVQNGNGVALGIGPTESDKNRRTWMEWGQLRRGLRMERSWRQQGPPAAKVRPRNERRDKIKAIESKWIKYVITGKITMMME